MKASASRTFFNHAFVLDESELRRIDTLLRKYSSEVTYEVMSKNRLAIRCSSVDEVINLPNPSETPIEEVSISTYFRNYIRITMNSNMLHYSVDVDDADSARLLVHDIESWFKELRPAYWWRAAGTDFQLLIVLLLSILAIPIAIMAIISVVTDISGTTIVDSMLSHIGFSFILFVAMLLAYPLLLQLFPVATFAIGHGIKRMKNLGMWRRFFFGTSGIAGALLIAFITRLLGLS